MKQVFFSVNKTSNIPEMLIYGYIGDNEEGVTSGDFVRELKALEKENPIINVRINSGGGSIFEGIAIYSAIKNSKAEINTYIDGMAASMASVIALAGKKVYMSNVARIMTHRASSAVQGSADNMRQTADLMESLEDTMCTIYAAKTGMDKSAAKEKFLGAGDKWMTSQEALDAKLVDEIFTADAIAIDAKAKSEVEIWASYNKKFSNTNQNMEQILLTAANLTSLNLKAGADPVAIQTAFDAIVAKAAKADTLDAELKTLKKETVSKEVEAIAAQGVKDGKFTLEVSAKLKAQFEDKPKEFKELVDSMQVYQSVVGQIEKEAGESELKELMAKDYYTLDKEDKLERLKALSETDFQAKYKSKFGKEYGKQ